MFLSRSCEFKDPVFIIITAPREQKLQAENSFLLTIQDATTSEPIFSATARLFNLAIVYNVTQYTGENGQTYFIPLQTADYDLEVGASGYLSTSTNVSISGDVFKTIKLEQIE